MNVNWFVVVVLEVDFWGGAKGGRQWSRNCGLLLIIVASMPVIVVFFPFHVVM